MEKTAGSGGIEGGWQKPVIAVIDKVLCCSLVVVPWCPQRFVYSCSVPVSKAIEDSSLYSEPRIHEIVSMSFCRSLIIVCGVIMESGVFYCSGQRHS